MIYAVLHSFTIGYEKMETSKNEPAVFFHLKWASKIALIIGVIATVGLLLAIFFITDDKGVDYAHVIANHRLTQHHLGPTLLVFGLALVLISSVTTWFIALYSSFRIAGPLFRFSQNLKHVIANAFSIPVAIRQTDQLQREWNQFDESQARLREHYADLSQALTACEQALRSGGGPDNSALQRAFTRLQEVERRVQI